MFLMIRSQMNIFFTNVLQHKQVKLSLFTGTFLSQIDKKVSIEAQFSLFFINKLSAKTKKAAVPREE